MKPVILHVILYAAVLLGASPVHGLDAMPSVHDPSTVAKCDDKYYVFGTGRGIPILTSTNGFDWQRAGRVFDRIPDSVKAYVPHNDGVDVWAPDVIRLNGQFYLYYSVSTWGERPSAVGLMTNPTLNPQAPNYRWTDCGMVVHSTEHQAVNAIDPGVMLAPDGRLWLCYGSYLGNIELIELNPRSGLRMAAESPVAIIASHSEAADLIHHDGYYYLFVNHGTCCAGVNSTYHIRVGRSKNVTGPYLDRHGEDLVLGAGSLFLASAGSQIGPGHFGLLVEGGVEKFSIHYEGELGSHRRSFLAIRPLLWTNDGWPLAGNNLKAGTYQICSHRNGEVLQTPPGTTRSDQVVTAPYLNQTHQRWTIAPAGGGCYRITNEATGSPLQLIPNPPNAAKAADPPEPLWQIDQLTDGTYRLTSHGTALVLATGTRNGLALEPFSNGAAQSWVISPP